MADNIGSTVSSTTSTATSPHPLGEGVFGEALTRILPELAALSAEELMPVTLDATNTLVIVRGHWPKLSGLREQLSRLTDFDVKCLDNLPTYLDAWVAANAKLLGTSLPPESLAALVEKVSNYRAAFVSDAEVLVKRGVLGASVLSQLKGAVGQRNTATDVLTLTSIFRANWEAIGGRTCVTWSELDEAELAVSTLLTDIGLRELTPAMREANSLTRQRAYTLFVKTYDKVRKAVSYLRWDEDDADEFAPSLFGSRKKRGGTDLEKPAEGAPATTPSVTAATATTTVAANNAAAGKPGIGLPGADPFAN